MPNKTPLESAEKWATNLGNSTTYITQGVNRVVVAPSQLAVAQQAKLEANWLESVRSGRWARNLEKVTLADWKSAMTTVGVARIRDGAMKAKPKLQRYYERAFPLMQSLEDQINGMPSMTFEDSVARAVAWMRGMREISNQL